MKTSLFFFRQTNKRTSALRGFQRTICGLLAITVSALMAQSASAVETSGSFQTTMPTSATVAGWNTGWGASNDGNGITGWDYVGSVNNSSGIYLGNGWVLTAAHVGAGNFTLSGATYNAVAGSAQQVEAGVDLTLFQIATNPGLPTLTLADSTFSLTPYSSQPVLIGYGDGGSRTNKTWGQNTVTDINQTTPVSSGGVNYISTDFRMRYGQTYGNASGYAGTGTTSLTFFYTNATNNATFLSGDSGGGDFVKVNGVWQLVGVNEAVDTSTSDSFSEQVSTYSTQIKQITVIPEPSSTALLMISGLLLGGAFLLRRSKKLRALF